MRLLTIVGILLYSSVVFSQLSGNVNVGSGQAYTSLTGTGGLFSAINSQGLSSNINVFITSDLSETGNNALNQWSGNFTVTITSSAAVVRTISGNVNSVLIDLDGCDGLTIDGRVGGSGKYLRFVNIRTQGMTFRFINDAKNNTITYCIIEGTNAFSNEGIIVFSTTTGSAGNDNNTISSCDIRDVSDISGATPINCIYSSGTTTTAAHYNSNISILNNNIFNFYRNGQNCAGVYINSGTTDWTISGNSFYQTETRNNANATGFNVYYCVTDNANNMTISNNYIGGTAPNAGGTPWVISGNVANYFYAVHFSNGGLTTASNVNGNIIGNINFSATPVNAGAIYFGGIFIENGYVNVGTISGNSIGNSTSNGNITVTFSGSTTNNIVRGIDHREYGDIENNTIGSINIGGSNSGLVRIEAINYSGTPAQAVSISNNVIGSTTVSGSIQTTSNLIMQIIGVYSTVNGADVNINNNIIYNIINTSTSSTARTRGIFQNNGTTGRMSINNNLIAELWGAGSSTDRFPNNTAIIGIFTGSSYNNQLVSGNTIRGLRGTGNSNSYVQGFSCYNNAGAGTFRNNKIYDLTHASTTSSPKIYGINSFWGNWGYYNNQITLTNGETAISPVYPGVEEEIKDNEIINPDPGNTEAFLIKPDPTENSPYIKKSNYSEGDLFSNAAEIKGVHDEAEFGGIYYYNTIYIGGSASSGNQDSWAWDRPLTSWPTPVTLRNNLFVNARTGGSGDHFAMGNEISPPSQNWPAATANYNVYITANAGNVGNWGTSTKTITAWRTSSGGDKQTWSTLTADINPASLFIDISNGNLNINSSNSQAWIVSGKGIAVSGQNTDYEGNARVTTISGGCTDIGADEFSATPPNCPNAAFDNAPGSGVTSNYTLWNRNIITIEWGTGGSQYPSVLNVQYFSGVTDPNASAGNYSNSHWVFSQTGSLTGATYNITIFFGDNETYTISTPNANSRLAKNDSPWYVFMNAGNGQLETELNWANFWAKTRGLNSFTNFVLTDGSNPLPVDMCSFSADVNNRSVNLEWVTCSEYNNLGFDVERRMYNSASSQYNSWTKIGFVQGYGTTNEEQIYKYSDIKLVSGKYQYRLKQIDFNGNFEYHNLNSPSEIIIGKPGVAELYQNYPNPSNPSSKVDFQIPFDAKVSLRVYDITGQETAVLVNSGLEGGYYTAYFNGSNFASGVYFYRLVAESIDGSQKFAKTMKLVLIK